MPKTKPYFSIIIPALNEEDYLPDLLSDLAKQSWTDFEVIVVDGDSIDGTIAEAKKFAKKISLTTVISDTKNVGYQRNLGVSSATADWIVFMDADNRLPHYFLEGIKYQLTKNSEVDIFTTWTRSIDESKSEALYSLINLDVELNTLAGMPSALGAMLGVKKDIFDEHQFDCDQKVAEDFLFVRQACKSGCTFKIFREPTFEYSLRRFYSNNTLSFVREQAAIQLRNLTGRDFKNFNGYPMLGGDQYSKVKSVSFFSNLEKTFARFTKKQFDQVQKVLSRISSYDGL